MCSRYTPSEGVDTLHNMRDTNTKRYIMFHRTEGRACTKTEGSGTSGTLHNRAWHNTTCKVQVHLLIASHENNTCTHTRAQYTRARNAHARATHTRATHTHACTGAYTLTRAHTYTHARAHIHTRARTHTRRWEASAPHPRLRVHCAAQHKLRRTTVKGGGGAHRGL